MECYRVGGAVRDRLLGLPINEKDYVVVGALPEELIAKGFIQVGKDFPVFLHPSTREEYALARTERKQGTGYRGFTVYASPDVTLVEDLKRRDLTVNAIAETNQGELIDPYGGRSDIEAKILRHVSPAFQEDPVRILRVARFMARFSSLGFKVDSSTLSLMRQMVRTKEVDVLVAERIWKELEKALAETNPDQFVTTLDNCGAWTAICPEWNALSREQAKNALKALQLTRDLTQDTKVRFASLMQYLALPSQNSLAIQSLVKRWHVPTHYRDLLSLSVRYRDQVHKAHTLTAEQLVELLDQMDALRRPDRFEKCLIVCEADWKVQYAAQDHYVQKTVLLSSASQLKAVNIAPLVNQGLDGVTFKEALRQLRIAALNKDRLDKA